MLFRHMIWASDSSWYPFTIPQRVPFSILFDYKTIPTKRAVGGRGVVSVIPPVVPYRLRGKGRTANWLIPLSLQNNSTLQTTVARFGPKVDQTSPKWDKSGTFSYHISVRFGSMWIRPGFVPFRWYLNRFCHKPDIPDESGEQLAARLSTLCQSVISSPDPDVIWCDCVIVWFSNTHIHLIHFLCVCFGEYLISNRYTDCILFIMDKKCLQRRYNYNVCSAIILLYC